MDLTFLNQTEYILDKWAKSVSDNPSALALTDERHPRGLSRKQVDELSARVYGWLKKNGIGREDFVLICLPRGVLPLISMLGVWKAGAAFTVVEDNYPPERIAYIKNDCSCKGNKCFMSLISLNPRTIQRDGNKGPCFTDEEMEPQRGKMTCPRSQ